MIHSGGPARRPQSGAPTVRVVHGGVQYREYLKEEQRSPRGCIAGRMQLEFHHGLLSSDRKRNLRYQTGPSRNAVQLWLSRLTC